LENIQHRSYLSTNTMEFMELEECLVSKDTKDWHMDPSEVMVDLEPPLKLFEIKLTGSLTGKKTTLTSH
jgi:hypothetical protein